MIWAALFLGASVLLLGASAILAVWAARRPCRSARRIEQSRQLVLPDEPQVRTLVRRQPVALRGRLPIVAAAYPRWSAPDQGWRREKPLKPWLQVPAPYAVSVGMGAVSLDLTALGLGVPEIPSTDLVLPDATADHDLSGVASFRPDSIAPSWERLHEPSHHWWA